jgi:HEAT repeat protein
MALTGLRQCREPRLLPELLAIVEARKDEARYDAIEAAAELGGHDAFATIAPLLGEPDPGTRLVAARVLAGMKHPEAARLIAEALEAETVEGSIRGMVEHLAELAAKDALPTIFRALKRMRDASALDGPLTELRGCMPVEVASYLQDREAGVRIAAAIVLGNSGRAEAVQPLLAAWNDPEYRVRQAVRQALKALRRSGVCPSLPRSSMRDRVAAALGVLAAYFRIPSSEGFSAYRTGWIAHFACSATAAAGIYALATTGLGLEPVAAMAGALAGVILLWGVGVLVGITSHYNPLIMLIAVGVLVGGLVLTRAMAAGLVIAVAGHALMMPFAFLVRLARRALIGSAGE